MLIFVLDDEADFEGDLPVLHLTLVDATTSLDDLEPTRALDEDVSNAGHNDWQA